MRNILLLLICALLWTGNIVANAQSDRQTDEIVARDSTVDVIGWFAEHDTADYWIVQNSWRFKEQDTLKTAEIATKVRIVVTDSTATGYKMEYTFLEFQADSIANSPMSVFQNRVVEKLGKKIVGTTISFETDELGAITKFNNLGKIKKQAKSFFNDAMKELFAMPEMKVLTDMGINPKDLIKDVNTDELVDGYLEDLKLLFLCHGMSFNLGETHSHEDASENGYENDSYMSVSLDSDDGSYMISNEVVNIIPRSEIKTLLGDLLKELTTESLAENMEKEFDSQVDKDATIESYYASYYLADGWPYKVVKQTATMIGTQGKAKQTYIYRSDLSTNNQ